MAFLLPLALATLLPMGTPSHSPSKDALALKAAGQNYAMGFYLSDPQRVLDATHRDLSKKGVRKIFGPQGPETMGWLEGDALRTMARIYDRDNQFNEATPTTVNVHEINGEVAVFELVAADWFDAFTAVRQEGTWRILDCVWGSLEEYETVDQDGGEAKLVDEALQTYARGLSTGSAESLERVLHPNFQMRSLAPKGQRVAVQATTRDQLFSGPFVKAQAASAEVKVFNATKRTAVGRVVLGGQTHWVQLLRFDTVWKIVNIHWRPAKA